MSSILFCSSRQRERRGQASTELEFGCRKTAAKATIDHFCKRILIVSSIHILNLTLHIIETTRIFIFEWGRDSFLFPHGLPCFCFYCEYHTPHKRSSSLSLSSIFFFVVRQIQNTAVSDSVRKTQDLLNIQQLFIV